MHSVKLAGWKGRWCCVRTLSSEKCVGHITNISKCPVLVIMKWRSRWGLKGTCVQQCFHTAACTEVAEEYFCGDFLTGRGAGCVCVPGICLLWGVWRASPGASLQPQSHPGSRDRGVLSTYQRSTLQQSWMLWTATVVCKTAKTPGSA